MRRLLLIFLMIHPVLAIAQEDDCVMAVMRFMGVTDLEEVDSYEVERLTELFHNPIGINVSSMSDLEKSGLLTFYQIVSLADYRANHGDVMSLTELSSIDGFNQILVQTLSPFISLKNGKLVDNASKASVSQELAVKGGYRSNEGNTYTYGEKYRLLSDRLQLGLSASRSYDAKVHYPSAYSANISWNHDKGKLILGDFNARFGQGLCLWNSVVFSSLALPSSYMKKPTGISQTNSFTGSSALTGLAGDIYLGKWKVSAMLAMPGIKERRDLSLMPAVNIARYGSSGMMSVTHTMTFTDVLSRSFRILHMKTSVDASICLRGVNIFGEAAFDWGENAYATVCGADFMASERLRMAFLLKYYPSKGFSNEYGIATSGEFGYRRLKGNFSLDGSYYPEPKSKETDICCQIKLQTEWTYMLTQRFMMEIRIKERIRTWGFRNKIDIRVGMQYKSDIATVIARFNALTCDKTGLLGYVDGGYTPDNLSVFLRLGVFRVDDWDDRIYVYERDAPANFNVPAYYGRGFWTATYLSCHPRKWLRLYLRVSYMSYMFMPIETRKPGRAELKFQCVFKF